MFAVLWRFGIGALLLALGFNAFAACPSPTHITAVGTPTYDPSTQTWCMQTLQRSPVTLTDGATITPDMSQGNLFVVTIASSRTIGAPLNLQPGVTGWIEIIQGGSGSNTITWNAAFKWAGATAPTLSTSVGAVDFIKYDTYTSGSNVFLAGSSLLNVH